MISKNKPRSISKRNLTLMAMITIATPLVGAQEISQRVERFAEICDANLRPEEKLSLWLYTGSTTSTEESKCMKRMAVEEIREIQNKNYLEENQGDKEFRELQTDLISEDAVANIKSISSASQRIRTTSHERLEELPVSTLRLPGYRSVK